jgi:Putative zinc-finger
MDCEKFDQHVMDALYDELDELTHAAMKRHMDGCARCASAFSALRATRDVGVLPLEEPSDELEARILEAVAVAQKKTPFHRKALRALAWAGSHAMRPQLAMAALFVLVIGSSLLLLRAKPGTVGAAPVRVTERGVPAPDRPEETATNAPPAAAPAPAEFADGRRSDEAARDKDKGERGAPEPESGAALALKEALSLKKKSGCAAALGKLDDVGAQFPGTAAAHTTMWEAAQCYQAAGEGDKARELLLSLRAVGNYRDRVEKELAGLDGSGGGQAQNAPPGAQATATGGGPGGRNAAAAPARAAAASPKTAAPTDTDPARPASPTHRAAPVLAEPAYDTR